jgi:hypothetical protein
MSEPILERLSQFTPDPGRLVRDELLFAAGRASARPNRAWISLAAALAGTQVLALFLLLPQAPLPQSASTARIASSPVPPTSPALSPSGETTTASAMASSGVWSVRHLLDDVEIADRPADVVTLIDAGPPLRAFGPLPSSIFD